MDAASTYLEPWTWAARDKAKKRKPFTVSHATYVGALVMAAHKLGFLNEYGEAQVGLVEVRVLFEWEIEALRAKAAA
jgi:hypothetical protein